MSNTTFGEVDWNSGDSSGGSSGGDFMRLEQGENLVRVMGNPIQFYVHWIPGPNGKNKKVVSPIDDTEMVNRLEDAGYRRQARWIIKVLDRSSKRFKVLEIGPQIYNGIKALYNNKRWGPVTAYDLSVVRGAPGSQPLYNVTPNPKEELDSSLKRTWVEFNDRMNFEKIIAPTPSKEIAETLGWPTSSLSEQVNSGGSSEDFEFDF